MSPEEAKSLWKEATEVFFPNSMRPMAGYNEEGQVSKKIDDWIPEGLRRGGSSELPREG